MHRVFSLLLLLALVSACASAPQPPEPSEALPFIGEPVLITFGQQEYQYPIYEPLIERFNAENPDVRVQLVSIDEFSGMGLDHSESTAAIARIADTNARPPLLPDVQQQVLRDLQPFIEADPTFDSEDFYPGALRNWGSADGSFFVLPRVMVVQTISYNKDLFAARGIPEPTNDWTWREMRDTAELLAQKDNNSIKTYGMLDVDNRIAVLGELLEADPSLATAAPDNLRIDQPTVEAALLRVADMADSGAVYIDTNMIRYVNTYAELIHAGRVGMWTSGMIGETPFEVGTVTLPEPLQPPHRFDIGYAMSAGTQHPEAAWRWLSFLSKQNTLDSAFSYETGITLPVRRSITDHNKYLDRLAPDVRAAIEIALARPTPETSAATAINHWIGGEALTSVLRNNRPVKQALQSAQLAWEGYQASQREPVPTEAPEVFVVATPVPQTSAQNATVIMFHVETDNNGAIRQLAEAFNREHPDMFVQVESTVNGWASTVDDLAATADCFITWSGIPTGAESSLLDLQPLLDSDATFEPGGYSAALLAPLQQDGRLYGLPYQLDLPVLAYSRTLFEEAGLAEPSSTWTLEDLLSAAAQIAQSSDTEPRYGYAALSNTDDLAYVLEQFDASLTTGSGDTLRPNLTDPAVVQATQWYLSLLSHSPHDQLTGYKRIELADATNDLISAGQVGLWFESTTYDSWSSSTNQSVSIAPPPMDGDSSGIDYTGFGLYISAQTPHAEACWTWMKYLRDDVSALGGRFPAYGPTAATDAFVQQARPGSAEVYAAYRAAFERMPSGTSASNTRRDANAIDSFWFYRAVDRALQGADLERELENAQFLTEQYLACVRGGEAHAACARAVDPEYDGWLE